MNDCRTARQVARFGNGDKEPQIGEVVAHGFLIYRSLKTNTRFE
jgi:hypothetical protein